MLPLATNRVAFFLAIAFVISLLVARLIDRIALRIGLADAPGGRKQHEGTIPLTGGIAMFAGFTFAALLSGLLAGQAVALVAGLGLCVFVGAADDMHDISPTAKLILQLAAALLMTSWAGVHVQRVGDLFGFGPISLYDWAIPFSVICALGVINSINMIDGVDGVAGGTALVAVLWLAFAALAQGLGGQALLLLLLGAAIAGFLVWNLRVPGRAQAVVFMGDSGSMMLGLALCWFSIDLTQGEGRTLAPIACMWILAVPLLDMARVMLVRMLRGTSMVRPDRGHLHHLLLDRGVAPQNAALILIGASVLSGALGVAGWRLGVPEWALSWAFIVLFLVVMGDTYHRVRRATPPGTVGE